MTQIITSRGGGGGGGGASYTAGCGIDITNNEISVDTSVIAEKSDLSGYQTKANMVCNLCNADNSHYPSAKAVSDAITSAGGGDMLKSVYDPNNVEADVFDYDNFINTPTIPTDNCQLANGCCYAKTCDVPTNNCQLTNGCGYTTCTGTLTASNISDTAYGSSWSGVTTIAPSKNAVYAKVSAIDAVIPSAATCSNQLADKNYVNDSINSVTAYYITKNAAGDQFATYSELVNAGTYYSGGAVRTPTRNDYAVVLDDETHDDETTRYSYQGSGWQYQYTINESPLTQSQLDAINSGITAAKVCCYDAIPVITNNCQIANGCGYTTCTGTVSSCADVISALGYTPYNSSNPSGYTTCTGTLTNSSLVTINGCCLVGSGNVTISGLPAGGTDGQIIMMVGGNPTWVTPTSCGFIMDAGGPTTIKYIWAGCQDCYDNLGSYDENTHYDTY